MVYRGDRPTELITRHYSKYHRLLLHLEWFWVCVQHLRGRFDQLSIF